MKTLLIALAFVASLNAQGTPWTTFAPQTASTNLTAGVDAKINWQTSTAACADKNGTVGKDLCIDTGTLKIYKVTVTGTPATWVDVAATAAALAATPTLCTTGQAPTGVLANGNATGCAAAGGGATTITAVTPVLGTAYQNTTGKQITVTASGFCGTTNEVLQVMVGPTSSPTNMVNSNWFQVVSSFNQSISGLVPIGYWYKFVEASGASYCTINGGFITQ